MERCDAAFAEPATGSDGMPLAARSLPIPCPKS